MTQWPLWAYGNPFLIAFALYGSGRAFEQADPDRALEALREGLVYSREQRLSVFEALIARVTAGLEAAHGEFATALVSFDTAIDSLHRAGNITNIAVTLASLAVLFDRLDRFEIAATIYGTSTRDPGIVMVVGLPSVIEGLRVKLGDAIFDDQVATGAAMELAEAVRYARNQIQAARNEVPLTN
jgi:hypothetical protein